MKEYHARKHKGKNVCYVILVRKQHFVLFGQKLWHHLLELSITDDSVVQHLFEPLNLVGNGRDPLLVIESTVRLS